ncbi:BON domain-containing protein [Sinorhizobium alkalisoli]|uniref:Transporter n=1 Tax=Sinorhizobium alkalisoli TaxID=1752398 RepID=A0A1E3V9M3_9HYPH|nr:BON domain-containing protein [Sinorhizobium alkalisoli]MCA1490156.1 BON domain-containing protein [Ensifer sp. NBAIM29]MCG5481258.1 BON domain-containing protein [Sinorhizobium alkalisoli]ODR90334.1 transporter [Sinorhizobium alkalisoli]
MATEHSIYSRGDDHPHLTDDALAEKVGRFLRYATTIDTRDVSITAMGNWILLSGTVATEADVAHLGEAAAAVIGVARVDNQLTARGEKAEE